MFSCAMVTQGSGIEGLNWPDQIMLCGQWNREEGGSSSNWVGMQGGWGWWGVCYHCTGCQPLATTSAQGGSNVQLERISTNILWKTTQVADILMIVCSSRGVWEATRSGSVEGAISSGGNWLYPEVFIQRNRYWGLATTLVVCLCNFLFNTWEDQELRATKIALPSPYPQIFVAWETAMLSKSTHHPCGADQNLVSCFSPFLAVLLSNLFFFDHMSVILNGSFSAAIF